VSAVIHAAAPTPRDAERWRRNIEAHELATGAVAAREAPKNVLAPAKNVLAPGFRLENRVTAGADEVYCGEAAWREWLDDVLGVFAEGASYSVDEIVDVREELVIASFSIRGRGASSGRWIEFRWIGVTWFREGSALRTVICPSAEQALKAAEA